MKKEETMKGAVVFVLVSNSGVKDGLVHVHRISKIARQEKLIGDLGSMIMLELQMEMKARHIPHSVTVPFPDSVEMATKGWFEANPNKLEKVVVICSEDRRDAVARGIAQDLPVALWTFNGAHDPEISEEGRRYFPGIYPLELTPDNDGIQRILRAMDEERHRSFFQELNAVLA